MADMLEKVGRASFHAKQAVLIVKHQSGLFTQKLPVTHLVKDASSKCHPLLQVVPQVGNYPLPIHPSTKWLGSTP